jgi:tetratricopeptide (TPR) repeat protein
MEDEIENADIVLIVCSEKYLRRWRKKEEIDKGKGVTWEGAIITQDLYDAKLVNNKFYPVLPDGGNDNHIPKPLRPFNNALFFPSKNESIYRLLVHPVIDPNINLPRFSGISITGSNISTDLNRNEDGKTTVANSVPAQLRGQNDSRLAPNKERVYGREQEIAEVLSFLKSPEKSAVVAALVTGTGGIGKTEVCKAALKLWLEKQPNAVSYYISFSGAASGKEAVWYTGNALGFDNITSFTELRTHLPDGLYYLDNLETVAEDTDGVLFLRELRNCPGVRILASSRVSIPALAQPILINRLPIDAAVTLFRNTWTREELAETAELREFLEKDLGCHALSVVLIAGLGEAFSFGEIRRQWKSKGVSLASQAHDQHQLGNLDVSLHLTSDAIACQPSAMLLWSIAALFPDGITLEQIDWFKKTSSISADDVQILTRHHILTRKGNAYEMLPPIARFGIDHALGDEGGFKWAAVRDSFLGAILPVASSADQTASTENALSARKVIVDFFPALHQFVTTEVKSVLPDVKSIAELSSKLRNMYQFNILLAESMLLTIYHCLNGTDMKRDKALAAICLGDLECRLGKPDEAGNLYEQAIEIYNSGHDDLGLANTLKALGDLKKRLDKPANARFFYEQAIELYRKELDGLGLANTLRVFGDLEMSLSKFDEARGLYGQAIEIYRKEQAGLGLANAFKSLGDLECSNGRSDEAYSLYNQAIDLYRKEQFGLGLANALKSLGDLENRLGKFYEACGLYKQVIELYRKEHNRVGLANVVKVLEELERRLDKTDRANMQPILKSVSENALIEYPFHNNVTTGDFINQVRTLNADTSLSFFQKNSIKKQIMKKYLAVRDKELDIKENIYIESLKMLDDVASKRLVSAAQKAMIKNETDFQEFVSAFGVKNDELLMSSIIKHAEMVQQQFIKLQKADIDKEIRKELFIEFRKRAKQTNKKLISGIEDYLEKLDSSK